MTHQRTNQRGFTLSEILVAIAVFTIIFIAALLLYDRANKVFKSSMQASDVQQNTRVAFERLVSELRMAGFDFDRDGYPTGTQKYQQPDEQLEFVHRRAITFRSNLDYESEAADSNGRESAYEPGFATTATTDDYFPIVTTANNEIVTYFLRSANSAANDDTITFEADTYKPRKTYPVTGSGENERPVTIGSVDLCQNASGVDTGCMNPPYTLYRATLKDDGTVDTPVPVAENVRSIEFSYFRDTRGTVTVTPNGGGGTYVVSGGSTTSAALAARELRAQIRAVHLRLTGMAEAEDSRYQDPIEVALADTQEVAAARSRRQYQLESMIVPRNLGKRGLQEIDVKAPGQPEITTVCTVGCGVVKVKWNAPETGTVTAYTVVYDTAPSGAFNSTPIDAGRNLHAYVPGLTPGTAYYFKVIAENPHGSRISADPGYGPIVPINRTRPEAPSNLLATGNSTGTPAAVANNINLTWRAPQNNIDYNSIAPANSCNETEPTIASQAENSGIIIKRSTLATFNPETEGEIVFSGLRGSTGAPTVDAIGNTSYSDATAKQMCVDYYYAVRIYENGCHTIPGRNSANNVEQALSPWSTIAGGMATSSLSPAAPTTIAATAASTCASNPCQITLRWPEVTTDSAGTAVQITRYEVRRRTYTAGLLVGGSETIFPPITDSVLGDGTVTYLDSTAPQPGVGTIYHYDVRASHCTAAPSAFSPVVARYPCAQLQVAYTGTFIDGSGTASDPWLVTSGSATIGVTSDTNMTSATATRRAYPSGTTTTALGSGMTANPRQAAFNVDLPGMGSTFEIAITVVDVNGCSTTTYVYVQESPTSCCLRPYKDATGTNFDTTVQTVTLGATNTSPATINVAMKNECDDILRIEEIKMAWAGSGTTGNVNNLVSIQYPGLATPVATPDTDGSIVIRPSSVAGASTDIPAATTTTPGAYNLVLTFSRSGGGSDPTTVNTITQFCVRYRRPDGTLLEGCNIIQNAGPDCP